VFFGVKNGDQMRFFTELFVDLGENAVDEAELFPDRRPLFSSLIVGGST